MAVALAWLINGNTFDCVILVYGLQPFAQKSIAPSNLAYLVARIFCAVDVVPYGFITMP